jgi:hypothetical protein
MMMVAGRSVHPKHIEMHLFDFLQEMHPQMAAIKAMIDAVMSP